MLGEWWRRHRAEEARHEAARRRLYDEYQARIQSGEADGLESARDYGDNDLVPWRTEVTMALTWVAVLALCVVVLVLVAFFTWVKHLTGGA